MVNFDYDCSGWATKANTKCYDGLTIAEDAFKGCSGQTVPMVYNHDHSSLDNVIGHALLENRKGGVYAYAKFNDTPTGQTAKKCVENGDLNAFSIWANGLQKAGQVVKHGVIRELSLVLAGCNPGALIQEVVKHSADNIDDEGCEAFIFNDPGSLSLEHGMDPEGNPLEEAVLAHSDDNKEDGKMAEETNGKTLEEVYNSMTDEQKECCHALVGLALEEQDGDGGEDEEDESDMKHNVFDKDAGKQTVLKHSIDDINSIIKGAKTSGTLKAAFDNAGVEQGEIDELSHGIDNIDWLFPEDHLLDTTPRIIDKPDDWVSVVMGGVKHIPFSRFKSMFADLTPEDARAKGYVKGNYKIEEVFGLLRRSTGPTTVYKKQKLDRDDVSDITSFDVVSWLRNEMRYKLNRELALAYILGDGRQAASEDKIDENCIGGNLMRGLATGVKSVAKFGLKVALSPAYAIISGFKHILGIHSPSKVMAGIGEYVVEGLTRGIVSTEGEAEKGMDEVGGAVIRSALATTNAIADYLSTDNHPSITPVVDLSDASRSSAWLNSAFADRKGTISMAATVTGRMARRAETSSRNQNGYETAPAQTQTYREVVEAVTALGGRIDKVAESVKGMKVVMNSHKLVGEIKSDINDAVGDIIEKGW